MIQYQTRMKIGTNVNVQIHSTLMLVRCEVFADFIMYAWQLRAHKAAYIYTDFQIFDSGYTFQIWVVHLFFWRNKMMRFSLTLFCKLVYINS